MSKKMNWSREDKRRLINIRGFEYGDNGDEQVKIFLGGNSIGHTNKSKTIQIILDLKKL